MNYPKHWKAYLNHLTKLEQEHKLMMDLKELEVRQEWNKKSFKEQVIDRLHFLPTVPDSIAFRRALKKLDQKNRPDTQPRLESYWTWVVKRKENNRKMSKQEVYNALGAVIKWSTDYMEAARKGDKETMERLDKEFDPEKIVKESRNT